MQCFGGSICNSDKAPFLATSKFLQGRVNVLQFMQANAKIIKDQSLKKIGHKKWSIGHFYTFIKIIFTIHFKGLYSLIVFNI